MLEWLNAGEKIVKQLPGLTNCYFTFRVRYYVPDPCELKEEYTRYYFFLQVRKSIFDGSMPCPMEKAIVLASYVLQSELGDYDAQTRSENYTRDFDFIPNQTPQFDAEVTALHRKRKGLSSSAAELEYLKVAQRLEHYGVTSLWVVKDLEGTTWKMGPSSEGISLYFEERLSQTHCWNNIEKIQFKSTHFILRLQQQKNNSCEKLKNVTFILTNMHLCQQLYQDCIDYHTFFRLVEPPNSLTADDKLNSGSLFGCVLSPLQSSIRLPRFHGRTHQGLLESRQYSHTLQRHFIRSSTRQKFFRQTKVTHQQLQKPNPQMNDTIMTTSLIHSPTTNFQNGENIPINLFRSHSCRESSRGSMNKSVSLRLHRDSRQKLQKSSFPAASIISHQEVPTSQQLTPERHVLISSGSVKSCSTTRSLELARRKENFTNIVDTPPSFTTNNVKKYDEASIKTVSSSKIKSNGTKTSLVSTVSSNIQQNSPILSLQTSQSSTADGNANSSSLRESKGKPTVPYPSSNMSVSNNILSFSQLDNGGEQSRQNSLSEKSQSQTDLSFKGHNSIIKDGAHESSNKLSPRNEFVNGEDLATIRIQADNMGRFGFNVNGGTDRNALIVVSRVGKNMPADLCYPRLQEGDEVVCINDIPVDHLTHDEVVQLIRESAEKHPRQLVMQVRQKNYMREEDCVDNGDTFSPSLGNSSSDAVCQTIAPVKRDGKGGTMWKTAASLLTSKKKQWRTHGTSTLAALEVEIPIPPIRPMHGATGNVLVDSMLALEESLKNGLALRQFEQMYRIKPGAAITIAKIGENMSKNRYRDIQPYDETRVRLQPNSTNGADYINASHINMKIPRSDIVNHYIATQGPMPNTYHEFWQMVWQENVHVIVMLTDITERGRMKCHQYWPNVHESKHYNEFQLRTSNEVERRFFNEKPCESMDSDAVASTYTERELFLSHHENRSQNGESDRHKKLKQSPNERRIVQLHYHAWPDFSPPEDDLEFFHFVNQVRQLRSELGGPVLVHCSAGIGRSGVLIAMETAMTIIEVGEAVVPLRLIQRMRDQRPSMIQSQSQYEFFCHAILTAYHKQAISPMCNETSFP